MRNYQTKSNQGALPDSITSTRFGAGEFNSVAVELEGAVTTSGQTLAPADGTGEVTDQLAMALAIYGAGGAAYHVDTGAVNAYVLTPVSPKESPNAYFNGFSVVFEPGTVNTTASTVNVASLGVKSITLQNGSALTGGELSGTCKLKYSLADDRFELISSSDQILAQSHVFVVDSSQADQGATSSSSTLTIYDVATLVGTSKYAVVYLKHNPNAVGNTTSFTFDTSLDLTTYPNLYFLIDQGARLIRTTGDEILTVYSFENLIIQDYQVITTAEMISFARPGKITAELMGGDNNGMQYALTLCQTDKAYLLDLMPNKSYAISTGLDATEIDSRNFILNGNNATLVGTCTGKPVLDLLGSAEFTIRNLRISGDSSNTPSHGMQIGRVVDANDDTTENRFVGLSTYGEFSAASVYNGGSEVNKWEKCNLQNGHATGYCLWMDEDNEAHIASDYVTVTLPQDTANSLNDNVFMNCSFEQIGTGSAIRICGTKSLNIISGYGIAVGVPGVLIKGTCFNLTLDLHLETTTIERNVEFLTSEGNVKLRGFTFKEYYAFGTTDVFDCDSASNQVDIVGSNISVGAAYAAIPIFGSTGTINVAGNIDIGVSSSLYDLSNMTRFNGSIQSELAISNVTMPASNSSAIISPMVTEDSIVIRNKINLINPDGSGDAVLLIGNDFTNKKLVFTYSDTIDVAALQGGAFGGVTRPISMQAGGGHVLIATNTDGASNLRVSGLATYADNAAALVGGLTAGDFYRTATGTVQVVY